MTLDELLLEWSYRSEKGYPELDNPSDIFILKQILEKLDLPSNTVITKLTEKELTTSDLTKTTKRGDKPDRAEMILAKIDKGEEFKLTNGSKIIIDPEQSLETIQKLTDKIYKDLIFTDTLGNTYKLTDLEKTTDLGGQPKGAGSDTKFQESAHCYACAVAYYVKQGPITEEDLTRENFEQGSQYVETYGAQKPITIDDIEEFLNRKPEWRNSIVKTVNKIYELFPNKKYTFHRDSEAVERLYNAFNKSLEKADDKSLKYPGMDDNKWNPADIWLFSPEIVDEDWSGNVAVLNGQIADYYEDEKLAGISLKKISKNTDAKVKLYNDPNIEDEKYEYEGYRSTLNALGGDIFFTGGKASVRLSGGISGFSVEISGKAARGGKASLGAINKALEGNNLIPLPLNSEVLEAFNNNDENYYNKLYYLIDRFISGGISKEDFKEKYDKSDIKWKMGNYYSLLLIERFEDNKPEPSNELMSDIIRYAYSSTSDSSKFAKIS
jgi:hypothetical protein